MGCITGFLLILNILLWIAVDILLWTLGIPLFGFFGVLSIAAFFLGFGLSVEMTLAPRDFWINSEWDIFIAKLGYANGCAFFAFFIPCIIAFCLGHEGLIEFLNF